LGSFGAQTRFAENNLQRIDTNLRPYTYLYLINRWINIRADACGSLMAFTAAILALHNRDISPGLVGFSLVNASGFGETILYLVRTLNELEIELNSFQRVMQYVTLRSEPPATETGKPPAAWPTDGDVVVKNLSVKYAVDGPSVLRNVSFAIKSKERIGICGRTGSGKSTLCLTLLRFTTKVGGTITINGLDIDDVNLEDLRDRVSIIPQDAILFSGTIRSNLDPFGRLDDAELNMALRQSGLLDEEDVPSSRTSLNEGTSGAAPAEETVVEGGSGTVSPKRRRITLDSPVTSNGDNFSQGMPGFECLLMAGQRQILALARALVRRSKVIILDEATASVDQETDERIQRALRSEFQESTLITIAHRLRTIMDYDKILVLDEGKVVEYNPRTPHSRFSVDTDFW
jgi:ABC-type multidrug transport system fused ATPase/permease subunit